MKKWKSQNHEIGFFLLYCSHTKLFKLQKTQRKMAAFCAAVILLVAHLRSNHSQK